MALIRRLGPLSKPSKLLQTILLETLNHQISPLLRLPRSLRFRIYDFVLDVPYSDALLSNLNHKDEIHIEWDPYKFYPVTRACRQLRKEMHPLFLQTTRRLWFQFDYMPITCGYLWRALKDFLPYIQALQVSFFPHLSRLLALLPSLKGILIETPEHTSYADSWVPWKQFEELAFEGDAPALELGDRILKRFGHYQIVNISIDFSVVTTRHEEMYHITGENDEFCRIKGRSGPMDKLVGRLSYLEDFSLTIDSRDLLWTLRIESYYGSSFVRPDVNCSLALGGRMSSRGKALSNTSSPRSSLKTSNWGFVLPEATSHGP